MKEKREHFGWLERIRTACFVIAVIAAALSGVLYVKGRLNFGIHALVTFTVVSALAYACIADARLERHPLPQSLWWLLVLLWPVAIPAYWITMRGWKGVWLVIRCGFLLWIAQTVGAWIAYFAPATR